MQLGLVISVSLHVAILAWALFTIQSQRELLAPEPDPIVTDLISESELTKLKKGMRTAKQLEAEAKDSPKADLAKKEAAKPKPVAAAPPQPAEPPPPKEDAKADPIEEKLASMPPPPAAEPPPPPKASTPPPPPPEEQKQAELALLQEQTRQAEEKQKADEQRKLDEQRKAEEQRKADEQRQAEEEKRRLEEQRKQAELKKKADEEKKRSEAAAKKKREEDDRKRREAEAKKKFDAEKIAALLNKVPDSSAPPLSAPPTQPTKAKGPALGAPEGRDDRISASELAMLKARISQRLRACWRLPSGGGGSDTPVVTLRWRLKPDGTLDGDPLVEQPRSDALFRIAAEAAMRAVQQCSPFDLPPERYNTWRTITWEFDPSQMM